MEIRKNSSKHLSIKILAFFIFVTGLVSVVKAQKNEETPPVTPYWALGHIVWEDNVNTQAGADSLINGYIKHQIPVDGIIIDSPWELHYNDFVWDSSKYPNPNSMIRNYMAKGIHTLLWMTGNINKTAVDIESQEAPGFKYALEHDYIIKVSGDPVFPWWKGDGLFLDFTNSQAVQWWYSQLDKAFVDGVYGWKVDNFRLPEGVDSLKSSVGMLSERDFKRYYYNCMYDYTVARKQDGIIIARPYSHQGGFNATVSKLNLGWCGDFTGDWAGLKLQINNIYKSAGAGYGALACEIGGFSGAASSKNQLIRYAQFASMVATMDNGGVNGAFENHLPWFHDSATSDIYRGLVNMHRAIRPYLFSNIVEYHLYGKDTLINTTSMKSYSHKLGNDIFTAAVTSDSSNVVFTLPNNDKWYDWWTGEEYNGGDVIEKVYPLGQFPLFIRKGAVIPLDLNEAIVNDSPEFKDKTVLLIYGNSKRSLVYHKPIGTGVNYSNIKIKTNNAGKVRLKSDGKEEYIILFKNIGEPVVTQKEKAAGFDVITATKILQLNGKNVHVNIK